MDKPNLDGLSEDEKTVVMNQFFSVLKKALNETIDAFTEEVGKIIHTPRRGGSFEERYNRKKQENRDVRKYFLDKTRKQDAI